MGSGIERFRVRSSGADLACVKFGDGPPLVCVHALAFSKEYFVSAADLLGAHFSCVAFDQRGHGGTEWEGGDGGLEIDAMAGDIAAVMDHLGWSASIVGGISLGAATALRFALSQPKRVTRLIEDLPAYSPASPRDSAQGVVASALERGDLESALRILTEGLSPLRASALSTLLRTQWEPFGSRLGPRLGAAFRASFRWRVVEDWPRDLAALTIPVEILGIVGDPSHPIEVAKTMAETLPQSRYWPRIPSLAANAVARQWIQVAGA
jgi:pimeloyl-ACP methyl ester carboxylesterase